MTEGIDITDMDAKEIYKISKMYDTSYEDWVVFSYLEAHRITNICADSAVFEIIFKDLLARYKIFERV